MQARLATAVSNSVAQIHRVLSLAVTRWTSRHVRLNTNADIRLYRWHPFRSAGKEQRISTTWCSRCSFGLRRRRNCAVIVQHSAAAQELQEAASTEVSSELLVHKYVLATY